MAKSYPTAAVAAGPDGVIISKPRGCYLQAPLASKLDGQSSLAQVTPMKSPSRRPNFHINQRRLYPHGQCSAKTSRRRPLPWIRSPSMEGSAGCPSLESVVKVLVIRRIPLPRCQISLPLQRTCRPQLVLVPETRSPTLPVWAVHGKPQIRKNVSNSLRFIPHRLRVLQGRLSYRYPLSLPGQPPLSPMTLERSSKDYERATVLMRPIPSPPRKKSSPFSGGRLLFHQVLNTSILSRPDRPKPPRRLKHNTVRRSAHAFRMVTDSRRSPTAEHPIQVPQFPPHRPRFYLQPPTLSLRAIHPRFCRSLRTHWRLCRENHTTCYRLR
ncbi:hypothetical protein F5148DRAFT_364226 [Russula earlei]|uniref:Uncharacterized protein n=1 Tax=Russula earlei TaxID=71964 RepID=A0ACC0U0S7_9AGAM|nr:hypothetical protein F5148DRAFT_364226 [Russula earlei]